MAQGTQLSARDLDGRDAGGWEEGSRGRGCVYTDR